MLKPLFTLLVFGLFCSFVRTNETQEPVREYKVLADSSLQDSSTMYFRLLLEKALNETTEEYGAYKLVSMELPYSQDRSLQFLNRVDILDIMHSMSSSKREQQFIAIKVPLLNGLMGKRMLFVHKDSLPDFSKITNANQLRKKIACQGLHWPDSDILEANNYAVTRVVRFEAMFEMLMLGRCDYFPRGIHEIVPEFNEFSKQYPDLAIVQNFMLSYPAPVYYFVGLHNKKLAERLELGLERLKINGSFEKMLKKNPLTQHVFPLSKWRDVTIFPLKNPDFPQFEVNISSEVW
ncbi:hypothetical protein [uncultured Paraglaciecola sp.]|jgi:hypothetical protein|uniref:substrate-binding periplasmic protein n=1 Tax=uncultured Paraglaciecola sp. TaxID=1765024 RepID=UPI0025CBF22E|nr:hypothetical protein [uncultured Paraglaciecola sp.]